MSIRPSSPSHVGIANPGIRAAACPAGLHPALPAVLRLLRPPRRPRQQALRPHRRQDFRNRHHALRPRRPVSSWTEGMLVVVFLMGLHSTIFSPAKYGIVPEMLADRDLSRANALLEMSTFVAIVLGIAVGGVLFAVWRPPWRIGAATHRHRRHRLRSPASRIPRVPARRHASPSAGTPSPTSSGSTRHLLHDKPLWLTVLGVSYFWFAGRAAQDQPAVLRQRRAARRRYGVSLLVVLPRHRHRRGQPAGRPPLRR